jgi:NifU-like protein
VTKLYPIAVDARFSFPRHAGAGESANAVGAAAALECGTFVKFALMISSDTRAIDLVCFRTNGCGFMVAAADVIAEEISGKLLTDLHGLDSKEIALIIEASLGEFLTDRKHCSETCIDALRAAFVSFRTRQIEEFAGEKALICTCFGVSEQTVEKIARQTANVTVEMIGERCNAGTGCGSCQPLIQEMIDMACRENL